MNVTLYGRTFNFHKVVQQRNSGAVEDFILPYSAVKPKVKELLKSVHICQSYRKNKSGTFFNGPRCKCGQIKMYNCRPIRRTSELFCVTVIHVSVSRLQIVSSKRKPDLDVIVIIDLKARLRHVAIFVDILR